MNPAPYPPSEPRPADFELAGRVLRFDYFCTHGRSLWQVWTQPKIITHPQGSAHVPAMFTDYACCYPGGQFVTLPKTADIEGWLLANTKQPPP